MRYATRQDLNANVESFETVSDIIMSDIIREQRAKRRSPPSALALLLDMDLGLEVGKLTPPVRIYRVGPAGELILKEQIQATTFRRRVMESIGGLAFQDRIADLHRKRRKAGQRSKAKGRAARIRAGTVPRHPLKDEDEQDS